MSNLYRAKPALVRAAQFQGPEYHDSIEWPYPELPPGADWSVNEGSRYVTARLSSGEELKIGQWVATDIDGGNAVAFDDEYFRANFEPF